MWFSEETLDGFYLTGEAAKSPRSCEKGIRRLRTITDNRSRLDSRQSRQCGFDNCVVPPRRSPEGARSLYVLPLNCIVWVFQLCGEGPSPGQSRWCGCANSVSATVVASLLPSRKHRSHSSSVLRGEKKNRNRFSIVKGVVAESINPEQDLVIIEFERLDALMLWQLKWV